MTVGEKETLEEIIWIVLQLKTIATVCCQA